MSNRYERVTITADTSAFVAAARRAAAGLYALKRWLKKRRHWNKHHPRPLLIDGHAYHRRRRARARRRR